MQLRSALLFDSPEQIIERVWMDLRPGTPPPEIRVSFRPFANANSSARLRGESLELRVSDVLQGAPSSVFEALVLLLLSKLLRRRPPAAAAQHFRLWMNRKDVRHSLQVIRRVRGRKVFDGPQGTQFDLEPMFAELNLRYFDGLMAQPQLGWSRGRSRSLLGHFDAAHNAIVLSRFLDRPIVPRVVVEYVLYHEMLHVKHPTEHSGARRRVHTRGFREDERRFEHFRPARAALKALCAGDVLDF